MSEQQPIPARTLAALKFSEQIKALAAQSASNLNIEVNSKDAVLPSIEFNPDSLNMLKVDRPRIVCLVGSTRFMEAFQRANYMESLAGRIVLSIGCMTTADAAKLEQWGTSPETKRKLDELHKAKIRLCDEIYVLNVDDYIGATTADEIEYALSLGKKIRWLEGRKLAPATATEGQP